MSTDELGVATRSGARGPVIEISGNEILLQGAPREAMTSEQAQDYLDRYPDGFLQHDAMDVGSFVVIDRNGVSLFYHVIEDSLTPWNWATDVAEFGDNPSAWSYSPGSEMAITVGGMEWWNSIRDGELTSAEAREPQPVAALTR